MSIHRLSFRNSAGLVLAVGTLLVATSEGSAQLRAPNQNKNFLYPPQQLIPILNNGSLQTSPNPNAGAPGQLAFSFIAGLPQDARLVNNGIQIWQPRMDAIPLGQQNGANNQNQTVTLTGPVAIPGLPLGVATLTGTLQGFNGRRSPYANSPYAAVYAANPNVGFGGYMNGFGAQSPLAAGFGSTNQDTYGSFGSTVNAFAPTTAEDKTDKNADDK